MSDGEAGIRAFGDLVKGVGGIAWTLAGSEGGLSLRDGAVAEAGEAGGDPRWRFEEQLDPDPAEGAATFRHLAIEVPDRGTLVCTSRGEPDVAGHGAEQAAGRMDGTAVISFEESLISTQYDGEGRPSRFGLELWPGEADPVNRAGATRTSGTLIAGGSRAQVWAGFFRCHTDGAEGFGTYLLWRA